MKRLLLFASIALFWASCQSDTQIPQNVIQPETMVEILVDANVLEGALKANFILGDSAKKVAPNLYEEIYAKHNTNATDFQKSIDWYFEHPEILEEIQSDVVAELMQMEP